MRMSNQQSSEPTETLGVLVYVRSLGTILFTTASYWLVGRTPEENHAIKGAAWFEIHRYRWAAWHYDRHEGGCSNRCNQRIW